MVKNVVAVVAIQWFLFVGVECTSDHPILLIVSYDGFRHDFIAKHKLDSMEGLKSRGTHADYLINVFPTKTFPNHHSIATGLYPEKHGVIGNSYWDQNASKLVQMSYELFHYDEEIKPIWRHNEDVGDGSRHSGSMMWPGASFPYQNENITYVEPFNASMDWFERVDKAISWMTDAKKPANLVMMYFEEPDMSAHAYGPDSEAVEERLARLDKTAQYIEDELCTHNLTNKINVIHLSDHGSIPVLASNILNISQYLESGTYKQAGTSPLMGIVPDDGYERKIYETLREVADENENFKVYKKAEYLDRWHYKNNPRTPPILIMAEAGFALDDLAESVSYYVTTFENVSVSDKWEFGVHGYDYIVSDMNPFFMARGPKIRADCKVPPFHTVDLFNLFCKILELPPPTTRKNDGSLESIKGILLDEFEEETKEATHFSTVLLFAVGTVVSASILVFGAALITLLMIKRQQNVTTAAALNKRFPQTFTHTIEAQHLLDPEDA